jgi:formate dehydrogenase major subunit
LSGAGRDPKKPAPDAGRLFSYPNEATSPQVTALAGRCFNAQDLFLTETARECGHVSLPASTSFEKDGTFMNGERRVQRVRRALPPPGEALPDWEILCRAARALGHSEGFAFQSPEDVWDEVRRVWPAGAGLAYPRLEAGGIQSG